MILPGYKPFEKALKTERPSAPVHNYHARVANDNYGNKSSAEYGALQPSIKE
jgi:hypothetical protein